MATTYIIPTFAFADDTKRKIEIGPLDGESDAVSNVKDNIKSVNQNISAIANLYLSDGGSECVGIVAADVLTTDRKEINLNVE